MVTDSQNFGRSDSSDYCSFAMCTSCVYPSTSPSLSFLVFSFPFSDVFFFFDDPKDMLFVLGVTIYGNPKIRVLL